MNSQKFINIYIFFGVILSICLAKFIWGWVDIGYEEEFEIPGEYSEHKYNPINEIIRYIIFIFLPLIVYLIFIKIYKQEKIKSIKEIFFYKNSKIFYTKNNHLLTLSFSIFLVLILLNFLSINLPSHKIDIFHEGEWLTSGINYLKKGGYWNNSYMTIGFFDGILKPLIGFEIFGVFSVGSTRFSTLLSILVFKIFLLILIYKLTIIQKSKIELKIFFFVLTSLTALSMTNYLDNGVLSYRELPLIIFLILLTPIISNERMVMLYCFLIGLMSVISMLWGIDRGAYLNFTLLILVLLLIFRKDFNKSAWIIFGTFAGWAFFYKFFGPEEFKNFLYNTKEIYKSQEWVHGIIHPEPFSSEPNSSRATKILLILIMSGLLIINLIFFKYKNISNESKISLIFIFVISIVTYKTGLGRSDGPHLKSITGLPLLLLFIVVFNLILDFIIRNKKYLKTFQNLASTRNIVIFIVLSLSIFFLPNMNLKNINNFKSNVKNYVSLDDNFFLTKEQKILVNKYSNLIATNKCVVIFTYETAIPYFLKKPTCNKYYSIWNIGSKKNQNLFVYSINNQKPNFILLGGQYLNPIEIGLAPHARLPIIYNFIMKNYSLYEDVLDWKIYKLNSS